jgi:pentapeptide MXKDX repeat protein
MLRTEPHICQSPRQGGARNFVPARASHSRASDKARFYTHEEIPMKKMLCRLMAVCCLALSVTAFAQSGDNMKQDNMKDDMKQDQMKDNKKAGKPKKNKNKKDDMKKHDDMKKDDGMKHDDMKQDDGTKK